MLFRALRRARLVDDGDTLQDLKYSKCGRTDKGVSALGQVVALRLRSRQPRARSTVSHAHDEERRDGDGEEGDKRERCNRDETRDAAGTSASASADDWEEATIPANEEMDYVSMLNRGLPPDIRVLGWTDVPEDFSARFSCSWRQYKYFFTFDPGFGSGGRGAVDIEAMQQAAKLLEGTHDFRNLCKVRYAPPYQHCCRKSVRESDCMLLNSVPRFCFTLQRHTHTHTHTYIHTYVHTYIHTYYRCAQSVSDTCTISSIS